MPDQRSPQLSLPILERVQLTFANFVDERHDNLQLLASLRALVDAHSTDTVSSASSVYLAGLAGSGKTHLLFAILNARSDASAELDCQYLDCARLTGRTDVMLDFVPKQINLLDNVDALQGTREDETALFGMIERIRQSNAVFVATASRSIEDVHWGLADVASRLGAALIFALKELDDEGTRTALHLRFKAAGLSVPDRVLDYMLTHFSRDKQALFRTVHYLDQSALREQRRITIPFLKAQLGLE